MKKLAKIAAILGASALLFGGILTGCYDGAQPPVEEDSATSGQETPEGDGEAATVTFLKDIVGGSSNAADKAGFFSGTKEGDLAVTVSDVELQLYKGTWKKADTYNTKAAASNNMAEGPAYVSGTLSASADAHANTDIFGADGWEMGRIKLTVKAGAKAVTLKSLSGYFASGKAFLSGYVKVGSDDYVKIEEASQLTKVNGGSQAGFVAKDFAVNKTIAANASKDVYILLGKNIASQPSTGVSIEVAELVLDFEVASDADAAAAAASSGSGSDSTPVTGITITGTGLTSTVRTLELEEGDTLELGVDVEPSDATNTEVTWISSNPTKVSVSEDGEIEAKAATADGVTITAIAKDGSGESDTITVTVKAPVQKTVVTYFASTLFTDLSEADVTIDDITADAAKAYLAVTPNTTKTSGDALATLSDATVAKVVDGSFHAYKTSKSDYRGLGFVDALGSNANSGDEYFTISFTVTPVTGKTVKLDKLTASTYAGKGAGKMKLSVKVGSEAAMVTGEMQKDQNADNTVIDLSKLKEITTETTVIVSVVNSGAGKNGKVSILDMNISVVEATAE